MRFALIALILTAAFSSACSSSNRGATEKTHVGQPSVSPSSSKVRPNSPAQHLDFLIDTSVANLSQVESTLLSGTRPRDVLYVSGSAQTVDTIVTSATWLAGKVHAGVQVKTMVIYRSVSQMLSTVATLPPSIDWITYDYEPGPGYTPEFTTDQSTAQGYFTQALNIAHRANKKLMLAPAYAKLSGANWNWSEIAKLCDGLDFQMQAFQVDPTLLEQDASNLVTQVHQGNSNALAIIQTSLNRSSPSQLSSIISSLSGIASNGILVFFQASDVSSLASLLNESS